MGNNQSKQKSIWSIIVRCTGSGNDVGNYYHQHKPCGYYTTVKAKDIFVTKANTTNNKSHIYYTFKCPICNSLTDINKNQLPLIVKYLAKFHKEPKDIVPYYNNDFER